MAKSIASEFDDTKFAQSLHQSRSPLLSIGRVFAPKTRRQLRALLRCTKIKFAFSLQLGELNLSLPRERGQNVPAFPPG
jgi:hypothetical protein